MSEWGRIPNSVKSISVDTLRVNISNADNQRINKEMNDEITERKRLGLPYPSFDASSIHDEYSKYEEEAELVLMTNKRISGELEKILLDTKEERMKRHK